MPLIFRLFLALLALCLPALSGCAAGLKGAKLPEGFRVARIAPASAGAPFAVSRTGAFASVADGAIRVASDGKVARLEGGAATALAFSPSGDRLAAALPAGKTTTLRIFDASGKKSAETSVPGKVVSLAWHGDRELLAGGLALKKYSFGIEVRSWLYQWDGVKEPTATALTDVTLRPSLGKLPEEILFNQLQVAVSPYGDEIAYTSLKDPPLFTPYLKVSVRHLETGAEVEVAKNEMGAGTVLYAPDGEAVLVGDSERGRMISIPDGAELKTWSTPGTAPALSPSGAYLFLDGVLYRGDVVVANFPPGAKGLFLPDGSGLAINYQGSLYRVTGLADGRVPSLPADLERILKLRRLRSQGLITDAEYRKERVKTEVPR